jgi:hypothetical protein
MAASHHCSGSGWWSDSLWVTLIRLWLQLILVAVVLAFLELIQHLSSMFTVEFSLQSHRYSFLITFNAWKLTLAFLWGGLFQNQLLLEEIDNLRRKVFVSHWASELRLAIRNVHQCAFHWNQFSPGETKECTCLDQWVICCWFMCSTLSYEELF